MKKYKKIYLEITSACNLACSFCPPTKRQKQFLAVEEFSRRLDQLKPHTDHLYFHVKGEPLLHPQIHELLDISHEKGFQVNLTTNGTLLAQRQAQILQKPALRQMNISLHSLEGQEEDLDPVEYLHPILTFVKEALRQTDMMISLRFWNLTLESATAEGQRRNRRLLESLERAFALDYRIEEKAVPGRGLKIAHRLFLHQDYEFQWPSLQAEEDDGKGFCYGLRHQVGILTDGTVVPCCLDGGRDSRPGKPHGKILLGHPRHGPGQKSGGRLLPAHRRGGTLPQMWLPKAVREVVPISLKCFP